MILVGLNKVLVIFSNWLGPTLMVTTGGSEKGGGHEGGMPHLPSAVYFIEKYAGEYLGTHGILETWVNIIFAFGIALVMCLVSARVYARRQMIPGPLQNLVEMMVEGMYNFLHSILGNDARRYVPFLGTLFFYILAMNWMGMVPLGHSPSTSFTVTLSMAIIVFLYAQSVGIGRLGIFGYLDHLAGQPRDVVTWCMVPLMFPIHIIGELAKPLSLSLRLFGNITGEDTLIAVFTAMGVSILAFLPVGVPLQLPFYFLGLILSTVQALVFSLLSTIYILLMLPHEEHG